MIKIAKIINNIKMTKISKRVSICSQKVTGDERVSTTTFNIFAIFIT